MKFSIGDQILLKRTGEEGRVVSFLSPGMMEVEVNGIHFPVYTDEVDHPYLKWFTDKKPKSSKGETIIPVERVEARPPRLAQGIYLSFLPQFTMGSMDDIIESFKVHLINETPDPISFHYDARAVSGASLLQHKSNLHAFGHIYLHSLTLEEMNMQPRFNWELAVASAKKTVPISGTLRIRPAQLVRYIKQVLEENKPAFSLLLAQDAEHPSPPDTPAVMDLPIMTGSGNTDNETVIHLHTTTETVLDLHIQKLVENHKSLSPDTILQIQTSLLHQKLQAAITTSQSRMVIIHGLGKGTLRQKVHDILAQTPGILSFSNHWMPGYGYGATEVIFDIN
jgi:hypothetical protein